MKKNIINEKRSELLNRYLDKLSSGNTYDLVIITWLLKDIANEDETKTKKCAFMYNNKFYAYYDGSLIKIGNRKMSFVFKYNTGFDVLLFINDLSIAERKCLNKINIKDAFHAYACKEIIDLWYKEKAWLEDMI